VVVAVPNQVPIEPAPTYQIVENLDGVTVTDLRALVAEQALAG
jgi:hypothetical protein